MLTRFQIWTDVDGVMTADPRIVANARSMEELSYEEVAELAYYGAKVLHPKTVTPAVESKIPLRVLNTFNPSHAGTRIVERTRQLHQGVKAITAVRELRLITVAGRGMIGVPGIAAAHIRRRGPPARQCADESARAAASRASALSCPSRRAMG